MTDVIVKDRGKGKSTILLDRITEYREANPEIPIAVIVPAANYRRWWNRRIHARGYSTFGIELMTPRQAETGLRGWDPAVFAEDVDYYLEGIYDPVFQQPINLVAVTASPMNMDAIRAEVERLNKPKPVRRITHRQEEDRKMALTMCAVLGINPDDLPLFSALYNMLNPIGEWVYEDE